MWRALLLGLLLLSPAVWSAIEVHSFNDPALQQRYQTLTWELRCPKCQNQNIADSDAGIAKDLRDQVVRLLNEGATDQEIKEFMVARYGDFVLYRPKVDSRTWLLWFGPFLVLGLGGMVVWIFARRHRRQQVNKLSAQERERLQQLLDSQKE